MLASYFTLAARIVRVPVCLWFWIDVRITNWAGQEDFFFFFFSASFFFSADAETTKLGRNELRDMGRRQFVILRLPDIWQRHKEVGIRAHRALGFVVHGKSKVAGIKVPDILTRRGGVEYKSWPGACPSSATFRPAVGSSTPNYTNNFPRRIALIQIHPRRTDKDKKILNYLLGWPTSWEIFKPKYLGIVTRVLEVD